jgi:hypothetical protein
MCLASLAFLPERSDSAAAAAGMNDCDASKLVMVPPVPKLIDERHAQK